MNNLNYWVKDCEPCRLDTYYTAALEAAREQAALERKARPAKEVKPAKKALPLAIINGEKIYGK